MGTENAITPLMIQYNLAVRMCLDEKEIRYYNTKL